MRERMILWKMQATAVINRMGPFMVNKHTERLEIVELDTIRISTFGHDW